MASQGPEETPASLSSAESVFEQVDSYPWDSDPEFQSGLSTILSPMTVSEQAEDLTLRAKCFFYARKTGTCIDFAAYKFWRARRQDVSESLTTGEIGAPAQSAITDITPRQGTLGNDIDTPAPYPTTFNQIVELISTGRPVPGIKEVPETVLEGQASQALAGKRRKPWEKDGGDTISKLHVGDGVSRTV